MMKALVIYMALFFCCVDCFAQAQINGLWGIEFGASKTEVRNKLVSRGISSERILSTGTNLLIEDGVRFGLENLESCCFFFDDNSRFGMAVLLKQIEYEDAFTTHLTYKQAEQWLRNNRYRVNQVITSLKRDLTKRYGSPMVDTEDHLVWCSNNGNIVEINIEKELDMFSSNGDQEAFNHYGAMPCWSIAVVIMSAQESL